MRKIFSSVAILAVVVTTMISCQKEVEVPIAGYTYTFALSTPETRALLATEDGYTFTKWENSDRLGVYTVSGTNVSYNKEGTITVSANPVQFQIYSTYALGEGDDVYCYFPRNASNNNGAGQNPTTVALSIPVEQNGTMDGMPMVSVPYKVSADGIPATTNTPVADINMINLGGVFQFRVYSSNVAYRTETVKSVEFKDATGISGSFVFDITQNSNLDINGNTGTSITVNQNAVVGADKEHGGIVNMVVKPGSYTGTLVVKTDAASYSFDISSAKTVERSHIKPLNVNLANGTRTAATIATLGEWSSKPISGSNSLNVNGNLTDDKSHSWSISLTGSDSSKNPSQSVTSGTTYWQIGANGNPATAIFSTNAIAGTITSIDVDCAAYQGKGSVKVTVGGNDFGTQDQIMPAWSGSNGGTLTFAGSASGSIEVTLAATTGGRAIHLSSIKVTYISEGGSKPDPEPVSVPDPSFTVASGTYKVAQYVYVANYDDNYCYFYTTDGTTPDCDSEFNATGKSSDYDYSTGITISSSCTLKMVAVDIDGNKSSVTSATYTIDSDTKVTFVAGTDKSSNTNISKDGITLTATTFSNDSYYQAYSGTPLKIESTVGKIKKIEITCTASGTSNYGPSKFSSASVGDYSYSGKVGTWTGSASTVSLSTSAQVRMTQVVVTLE